MSRSVLSWIGGKSNAAKRIISHFCEHTTYIEVFGGGGHVLCTKAPSLGEVYNDLDANLVNFFRVARDRGDELLEKLRWEPYSRRQFKAYRAELRGNRWAELPELDRAVIWYSYARQCFSSALRSGSWGYTTWKHGRAGAWQADSFVNGVERLLDFRNRLRHVQIECLDFEDCIHRYEGPEALIYADPPYVGTEDLYVMGDFDETDHRRLAAILHETPAKVVLSYEDHPLVTELYAGWRRDEFRAARHSQKSVKGQSKKVATEVLLFNW